MKRTKRGKGDVRGQTVVAVLAIILLAFCSWAIFKHGSIAGILIEIESRSALGGDIFLLSFGLTSLFFARTLRRLRVRFSGNGSRKPSPEEAHQSPALIRQRQREVAIIVAAFFIFTFAVGYVFFDRPDTWPAALSILFIIMTGLFYVAFPN